MRQLIFIFVLSVLVNIGLIYYVWVNVRDDITTVPQTIWQKITGKGDSQNLLQKPISSHVFKPVYPDRLETYNDVAYNSDLGAPLKEKDVAIVSLDKSQTDRWGAEGSENEWLKTKLSVDGKEYYIVKDSGPSGDPHLEYYIKTDKPANDGSLLEYKGSTPTGAIIQGNGFIYTSARQNETFTSYRKYQVLASGELREVIQPFLYAGIPTKALKDVTLFSGNMTTVIANIAAGSPVEIVLMEQDHKPNNDFTDSRYLIRTQNNILGWASGEQLNHNNQCGTEGAGLTFAELCFIGD